MMANKSEILKDIYTEFSEMDSDMFVKVAVSILGESGLSQALEQKLEGMSESALKSILRYVELTKATLTMLDYLKRDALEPNVTDNKLFVPVTEQTGDKEGEWEV